jgi:hypothetical protein
LRPVAIGHHGETMERLLRPGFHSGTIPKLFGKLRSAIGWPEGVRSVRKAAKARMELHAVEHGIEHFARREILAIAHHAPMLRVGAASSPLVQVSTNRVRIWIGLPNDLGDGVWFEIERRGAELLGRVWDRTAEPSRERPEEARMLILGCLSLLGVRWVLDHPMPLGADLLESRIAPSAAAPMPDEASPGEGWVSVKAPAWETWVMFWEARRAGVDGGGVNVGLDAAANE